ncbi:transcriptional regulator, y4mF family [Agrobacterium sp. DSM 25558]|uniref:Transcriptional regulator, y4mF family n=2 Tax=Agrobacterium rosae TaxID=1972867 RepID=A0A1R3THG5_9HYPH|nr:transcriptional regulator, y4mF family [Agrobacterium sp. DSM 25558]SCX13407.1 transcriptional regulator, y4mF family [Agrobacterium rosae]
MPMNRANHRLRTAKVSGNHYVKFYALEFRIIMKKSPNSIDIHVGSRIRLRRVMLGLSQEKLGDGLGITFQQVQKYEKGTNRVGASRLQHISELLDVHISYFFEGVPDAGNDRTVAVPSALSQFLNSKEGISLAKAFSAIKDVRVRRRVLELVQSLGGNAETDAPKTTEIFATPVN